MKPSAAIFAISLLLLPAATLAAPAPRVNPPAGVGPADNTLCLLERRATALEVIAACTRVIAAARVGDSAFMLSEAYNERGRAHAGLMHSEEALADFAAAILLDAGNGDAHFNRATILMNQKKYEPALKDLDVAVDDDPMDALALFDRGIVKLRLGDKPAAEMDFKAAAEIDPRFEEVRAQIQ